MDQVASMNVSARSTESLPGDDGEPVLRGTPCAAQKILKRPRFRDPAVPASREPGTSRPRHAGEFPQIWRGQDYYRDLLIALVALTIAYPLISAWPAGRLIEQFALVGVLVTSTLATYKHRSQIALALIVGGIMIIGGVINFVRDEAIPWLELTRLVSITVFMAHVTFALARDIFSSREKVTAGLLYGAVSVYLLIGMAFASSHFLLETLVAGSYQCGSPLCNGTPKIAAYVYYSFITLSTVGYGEIIPATPIAAMFAYVEAIIGQMYTAVLVARLVGMQLVQSQN